ncbi:TehB: predicted tellurite resistance protein [Desulfosarcina variabilis str. Montpellier]|uniref:class I SAM-dependent methyltransferase n=1 Tax=Desulfosarcina variabilis TaxID=2300 RepID=UPI003AFAF6EB
MTDQDRKKWDTRYKNDLGDFAPSSILTQYWQLASCGSALDIACGNGRNSFFLAEKGFTVEAVDISTVATGHLNDKHPGIHVICQDLDTWKISPNRYDLIVNVHFLDRRLFPMIERALKPDGVLIFESFISQNAHPFGLRNNELLHAFQTLRIIYYEEKPNDHEEFNQMASLVAVKQ